MLEKTPSRTCSSAPPSGAVWLPVLETARTTLSLSLGLAHVNEHFTNSPNIQTPSVRWGLRWEYGLWPDRVKVFHRHEGFWDVNAGNAFRLNADQGLRITVYKNLFCNIEYDFRLNTQPAPGRKRRMRQ